MGQQTATSTDPIGALYDAVAVLTKQVRSLQGRKAFIQIRGNNPSQDDDGGVWIDNGDHSIHYTVNGNEYMITGTLV